MFRFLAVGLVLAVGLAAPPVAADDATDPPISSPYAVEGWLTDAAGVPDSQQMWVLKDADTFTRYEPGVGWERFGRWQSPWIAEKIVMGSEDSGWALNYPGHLYRWNGETWDPRFPAPFHDLPDLRLSGMAMSGPDDLWLVGQRDFYEDELSVWHKAGGAWKRFDLPANQIISSTHVVAVAPDDVWVVGTDDPMEPHAVAQHYDGTSWTDVPVPFGDYPLSLAASGSGSVWLAAQDYDAQISDRVLRWDGTQWKLTPAVADTRIFAVAADSDGAWLQTYAGERKSDIIYRYRDGAWTQLPQIPNVCAYPRIRWPDVAQYGGMAPTGSGDLNVVGTCDGRWKIMTLAMHWDGSSWSRI